MLPVRLGNVIAATTPIIVRDNNISAMVKAKPSRATEQGLPCAESSARRGVPEARPQYVRTFVSDVIRPAMPARSSAQARAVAFNARRSPNVALATGSGLPPPPDKILSF